MLKNSSPSPSPSPTTNNFIVPINYPHLKKILLDHLPKLATTHNFAWIIFSIAYQFFLLKLKQESSNYAYKVRKKIGMMFNTRACIHLKGVRFNGVQVSTKK